MKSVFNALIVLITLLLAVTSHAQKKQSPKGFEAPEMNTKICKSFFKVTSDECAKSICLQMTDEETDDCAQDGTFWEMHNMCVYDELLPNLISTYNTNNPNKKINCETVEVESQTVVQGE